MSTTKQYTMEEIRNNFIAAQKRIKTGTLSDSLEARAFIERLITQYVLARQLAPTEENFYAAFQFHLAVLPWAVKPAKLIAMEENARPATITPAAKSQEEWSAKIRAGEVADAKKKADAETLKKIEAAITAYTPITSNGRVAFGKQSEVQIRLRAYVAQQVGRNAEPGSILAQVEKHIAELYRADELKAERV